MSRDARIRDFLSSLDWGTLEWGARSDLANACGISNASVYKWENGLTTPRQRYWAEIEKVFGLEIGAIAEAAGLIDQAERDVELDLLKARVSRLTRSASEIARELDDIASLLDRVS